MERLNRNVTNEELITITEDKLKDKLLMIVDNIVTSNPEYTMLYVVQVIDDLPSIANVSEFEAIQLGWETGMIIRAMFNAKTDIAGDLPKGTQISGARIRVYDTFTPDFDEQNPRLTREKDGVRVLQGDPIYRHTQVVYDHEFSKLGGHSVIDYDGTIPITEYEGIKLTKSQSIPVSTIHGEAAITS